MWYLVWVLGVSFALLLSIVAALWGEYEHDRKELDSAES